jgi:hypothetical protein
MTQQATAVWLEQGERAAAAGRIVAERAGRRHHPGGIAEVQQLHAAADVPAPTWSPSTANARTGHRRPFSSYKLFSPRPTPFLRGTAFEQRQWRPRPMSVNVEIMAPFLYHCPATGLRVQGWTEVEESEWTDDDYESISCLACGGVHFVNPKTGKNIGEKDG